ncbi:MAG: tetratricopeptide repeat protein [Myxococcales bacterium]|nr:tetratricopeptide repeat protein [Myxococcales bacterium]
MNELSDSANELDRRVTAAVERGWVALELGRAAIAEREARAALALSSQHVEARLLLADALLSQKRGDEAIVVVEEAFALAPDTSAVHLVACAVFCETFALDRAFAAAKAFAQLEPDSSMAHSLFAEVAHRGGDFRAAAEHARRALAIDPDDVRSLELFGLAQLDLDPRQAEAAFLRQLSIDPNASLALNNLGVALERQGRLWEAAKLFESAVRRDPTNELARNNTRLTLRRWSGPAAGLGLGAAIAGSKGLVAAAVPGLAKAFSEASPKWLGVGLALVALVGLGVWGFVRGRRAFRLRKLEREDPALYRMFVMLERDAVEGRATG